MWRSDPSKLATYYLDAYPGTKGELTYWLCGEEPTQAARRLSWAGLVISGDVAADHIAPWRIPTHLVAYSADPMGAEAMSAIGFADWEPDLARLALIQAPSDTWLLHQVTIRGSDLAPRAFGSLTLCTLPTTSDASAEMTATRA